MDDRRLAPPASVRGAWLAMVASALLGCGGGDPRAGLPDVTLAELRAAAAAPDYDKARATLAGADIGRGEALFGQCLVCHEIAPGQGGRQGPSLAAIWGRAAGTQPGFAYSDALASADIVWTPQAMDAWIASPLRLLPGSSMSFAGLFDALRIGAI